MALRQTYLKEFKEFYPKMVFGMNQVDLVEPLNWNQTINLPSEEQEKSIDDIVSDRREKLEAVVGKNVKVLPYL